MGVASFIRGAYKMAMHLLFPFKTHKHVHMHLFMGACVCMYVCATLTYADECPKFEPLQTVVSIENCGLTSFVWRLKEPDPF